MSKKEKNVITNAMQKALVMEYLATDKIADRSDFNKKELPNKMMSLLNVIHLDARLHSLKTDITSQSLSL